MAGTISTLNILWILSIGLQVVVLITMTVRKQYRDLPALYCYVVINLLQAPAIYLMYQWKGYYSRPAFWTAWTTQAVVVAARWLAVCELFRIILSHFSGIWGLAWRIFVVFGSLALLLPLFLGGHDYDHLVSTFDLGIELSVATVLVTFFLFTRYYRVEIEFSLRSIGIAFCLYSCFRAFNDTFVQQFLREYSNTWTLVDAVTYIATVTLIGWALYVLHSEPARQINLLPRKVYGQFVPQANERLSALNERLNQLLKSKAVR